MALTRTSVMTNKGYRMGEVEKGPIKDAVPETRVFDNRLSGQEPLTKD